MFLQTVNGTFKLGRSAFIATLKIPLLLIVRGWSVMEKSHRSDSLNGSQDFSRQSQTNVYAASQLELFFIVTGTNAMPIILERFDDCL